MFNKCQEVMPNDCQNLVCGFTPVRLVVTKHWSKVNVRIFNEHLSK